MGTHTLATYECCLCRQIPLHPSYFSPPFFPLLTRYLLCIIIRQSGKLQPLSAHHQSGGVLKKEKEEELFLFTLMLLYAFPIK